MEATKIKIKIKVAPTGKMPTRMHQDDIGYDLYADIEADLEQLNDELRSLNSTARLEGVPIPKGTCKLIKTGIALEIPPGYEGQIRSRSGLAVKNKLFVLNSPGTIDPGYRGEIGVILQNLGRGDALIRHHDRVAQLVIQQVPRTELEIVKEDEDLSTSDRSTKGFGSTGI